MTRSRRPARPLALGAAGAGAVAAAVAVNRRVQEGRRYRAELTLPRAGGSRTVRTEDGVALYVEEDGDPEAPVVVVFSHGFTARLEEFDLQREALRSRARLVFYDQRGHGRSEWGDVRRATIAQAGRDLGAVLDSITTDRPIVLVGHSMGGMSIMSLLANRPELLGTRVAGLGLIATSAKPAPSDPHPLAAPLRVLTDLHLLGPYLSGLRVVAPALEAVRARGTRRGRAVTRRFLFGTADLTPYWLEQVQAMLEETPLTISAAFLPTFLDHDDTAALSSLGRVPVAVVVGTDDALTPLAENRRIAEAAGAAAEFVVVPGAGHSVNATRPDEVNGALLRLLDRVLAERAGAVG